MQYQTNSFQNAYFVLRWYWLYIFGGVDTKVDIELAIFEYLTLAWDLFIVVNPGLFFQHLSGILSIWICRSLELFWFLLSYFGQYHWVILQKMHKLSHFTKIELFLELYSH